VVRSVVGCSRAEGLRSTAPDGRGGGAIRCCVQCLHDRARRGCWPRVILVWLVSFVGAAVCGFVLRGERRTPRRRHRSDAGGYDAGTSAESAPYDHGGSGDHDAGHDSGDGQ
jgi:hypothetical protein